MNQCKNEPKKPQLAYSVVVVVVVVVVVGFVGASWGRCGVAGFVDMGIDLKVHERSFIWNSHFGY